MKRNIQRVSGTRCSIIYRSPCNKRPLPPENKGAPRKMGPSHNNENGPGGLIRRVVG